MIFKESKLEVFGKGPFKIKKVKCISTKKKQGAVHAKLYDIITTVSADSPAIKKALKNKVFPSLIISTKYFTRNKVGNCMRNSSNQVLILKMDGHTPEVLDAKISEDIKYLLYKQKFLIKYFKLI